ncbi:MAG: Na+/H+ antiporter NhaC family protein [Akkermansiaceae bacterium]
MDFLPLLPPLVALFLILWTRQAALSLAAAVVTGVLLIHSGHPVVSLRALFENHLFPVIRGDWNLSAILFTLTLGAFASVLEKGGGFTVLLHRLLARESAHPQKKLLFGIYGLGLLCFFDGLANSVLLGRISRPLTDALKISRQFLAYLIDSTAACVACVAFISTWIATQLSLIEEGLKGSSIEASPATLFFSSIPANPYCLLTLALLPLVIAKSWHPGPMGKAKPSPSAEEISPKSVAGFRARTALIPLAALVLSLPGFIYLWQDGSSSSWKNAFSSDGVPYAMAASGIFALIIACLCFPKTRRAELPKHSLDGAASLIPALLILVCAWSLGSVMKELGTAQLISDALNRNISLAYLPLIVFLLGAVMSFLTGTSWGTMGLLMPLVLQSALGFEVPTAELSASLPLLIGAVFGGAVFGDHCSPFSDTTIVSALAAGCSPTSHVITQLPYALLTAGGAAIAYLLMALSLPAGAATLVMTGLLAALVLSKKN